MLYLLWKDGDVFDTVGLIDVAFGKNMQNRAKSLPNRIISQNPG